jgi:hypothetical protein
MPPPYRLIRDARSCWRDAVALGDGGHRLAGFAALDGFYALIVAQLAFAAELDPVGHCPLVAFHGTLTDQVALKVGYGGVQRREQPGLASLR